MCFYGVDSSIEGLLIFATGKPHPLWQEFGEAVGSHPGGV